MKCKNYTKKLLQVLCNMNTKMLLRGSLVSLMNHKGRSLLTMLGIIVGIAAIIVTMAIGNGAEEKLRKKYEAMGDNFLYIFRGNIVNPGGKMQSTKLKKPRNLTYEDIRTFKKTCFDIKGISPALFDNGIVEYRGIPIKSEIKGGNYEFLKVLGRKISKGSFFTKYHDQKGSRVAVIGNLAAKELFKTQNPIGKIITIKKIQFIVIGVVQKFENFFGIRNPNLDVFIPVTTAQKYFQHSSTKNVVHEICISSKSLEIMPKLVKELIYILRARHHLKLNEPNDFTIIDQQSIFNRIKETSAIFNLFLLIVASISLLVGGIGVMNIMLVSVSERTREIGIRMAIGALSRTILKQFLIESVVLCTFGGLIGIIIGLLAPYFVATFSDISIIFTFKPILLSFFTIFVIGIIFGLYPAYKASQLNPIEALLKRT
jgi:putative ABC transport system permease protein